MKAGFLQESSIVGGMGLTYSPGDELMTASVTTSGLT